MPATNSFTQVAAPGSGDKIAEFTFVDGSGNTVKVQAIAIVDASGNMLGASGAAPVATTPHTAIPTPIGSGTLQVGTTPIPLSNISGELANAGGPFSGIPAGATHALITVDGGDIRFWEDGNAPSSAGGPNSTGTGMLVVGGNAWEQAGNLSNVQVVQTFSTGPVQLNVSFRKYA